MEGCVATVYVIEPDAAIRDAMQTLLSAFEVPVLTYAVPEEFMSTLSSDISGCVLCEALLPTGSGPNYLGRHRLFGAVVYRLPEICGKWVMRSR